MIKKQEYDDHVESGSYSLAKITDMNTGQREMLMDLLDSAFLILFLLLRRVNSVMTTNSNAKLRFLMIHFDIFL